MSKETKTKADYVRDIGYIKSELQEALTEIESGVYAVGYIENVIAAIDRMISDANED